MKRDGTEDYGADLGAAALERPADIIDVARIGGKGENKPTGTVKRYRDECVLDELNHRGQLTDRRWRAGILFRMKWLAAFRPVGYGSRYEPRINSSGRSSSLPAEEMFDAEDEITKALAGIPIRAAMAVQAVAGEDESAKGRLAYLTSGLDHLILFYAVPDDFRRRT